MQRPPTTVSLPAPPKRKRRLLRAGLISSAVISFSLTFAGVGLALAAGYVPVQQALVSEQIEAEVVLLFVPLCALVFAIVAEVLRMAVRSPVSVPVRPRGRPLSDWTPGHGEG